MSLELLDFPLPPFRSRFPWLGGHLQTIATQWPVQPAALENSERLEVDLRDGTGDRMLALLDRAPQPCERPVVVLVHGVTGSETSPYMLSSARWFLAQGHDVVRLNLRGAGPSRAVCGGQYHAGSSSDLWAFLRHMPPDLAEQGIALVGFSLGGAVVLKYLGEAGTATPVAAAATICAPLDLAAVVLELQRPRNLAYQAYMLAHMKSEATAPGARLTDAERQAILAARSVLEFEDRFIAPRLGFASASEHHEANSPLRYLRGVEVPTLCIAAADDPYVSTEPYNVARAIAPREVRFAIAEAGGHIGFHDADDATRWHDRAVAAFFDRVIGAPVDPS